MPPFLLDKSFHAAFSNLILCAMYAWVDYGRGFLESHPFMLDELYILFAWSFVVNAALYLSCHEGSTPWPSGWTMLGEWSSFFGACTFAATSIMYLDKSGQFTVFVLVIEAIGALLYAFSSIMFTAGWWLERPLHVGARKGPKRTRLQSLVRLVKDPYMWAHATNFLPSVVYIASNMTATELYFFRRPVSVEDADIPQFPELLRQLSRIYWYGDLIWLLNSVQWLVLYFDSGEEVEEHPSSPEAPQSKLLDELMGSLHDSGDGKGHEHMSASLLQAGHREEDVNGGLVVIPDPIVRSPRRKQAERKWKIKDYTPYRVLGPCIRSWDSLFGISHDSPLQRNVVPAPVSSINHYPAPDTDDARTPDIHVGRLSSGRVLRLAVGVAAVGTASASPPRSQIQEVEMQSFSFKGADR